MDLSLLIISAVTLRGSPVTSVLTRGFRRPIGTVSKGHGPRTIILRGPRERAAAAELVNLST
jgi:hypothetical protein